MKVVVMDSALERIILDSIADVVACPVVLSSSDDTAKSSSIDGNIVFKCKGLETRKDKNAIKSVMPKTNKYNPYWSNGGKR